ncbi:3-hydroxyacyl-CoA dehydrogenase family protein [uncultured Roseobacter sp.]|uniref:3-hydroxyacyl-CoA dehydrogenase family protein n=1 Tax=uncultured Roseobacter sp. TaxID=114847 RepID=UPI0026279835|nr:3-hydroxyacyl-CoA dehydrogenase family protein [uncultured Roseobacter sp.]
MTDAEIAQALTDGLYAAADQLLMQSTNPWELDAAMTDFGFPTGVCEGQDDVGLDAILQRQNAASRSHEVTFSPILPRMVAEGRLGRKVGVGWYRYPGGGGLVIDPLVEDLLREEAWFAGITRVELRDEQILQRLVAGIVLAALDLMTTGGAHLTARVNHLSISALGFPAKTGGALSYARTFERPDLVRHLRAVAPNGKGCGALADALFAIP